MEDHDNFTPHRFRVCADLPRNFLPDSGGAFHLMSTKTQRRVQPAFQLYVDDFISGTADMSPEEVGTYIRLLCYQWNRGSIPVETERQQRLAGGCVSVAVLAKFPVGSDGLLRNERMEKVRAESDAYREMQSKKGKLSAEKRKSANHGSTGVATAVQPVLQPEGQPNVNSPSPSPSPKEYTKELALEVPKKRTEQKQPASPWVVAHGVEMPENLRTQPCMDAVRLWLKHKSEIGQTYKQTGLRTSMNRWGKDFDSSSFPAAVENSIARGWQGIYAANNQSFGAQNKLSNQNEPRREKRISELTEEDYRQCY